MSIPRIFKPAIILTLAAILFSTAGFGQTRKHDLSLQAGFLSGDQLSDIFESKDHGIWLLSNDGLFHYDDQAGQMERHGYDREKEDIFISQDINRISWQITFAVAILPVIRSDIGG